MNLEALMGTFTQEAQNYLDEHPESTISFAFSHEGNRHVRYLRTAGAEHVELPDEQTLYEIASTSKVFLAALIGVLEQRGLLGLEDPVGKHLPPHLVLEPEVAAVTIRELATHSSGLPDEGQRHLQ